ncbi:glycine betaine ABC transporter substrate-binding protein [Chloroflexota bacterium]
MKKVQFVIFKVCVILLVALLAIGVFAVGCGGEKPSGSTDGVSTPKETIVITELNWDSPRYTAYILAFIVEHGYDYPVEMVAGTSIAMFQGIMAGHVDIYPEIWLPNQQQAWDKGMETNSFIPVAITNKDNWQSLFTVPTYVIKGDPARGIEPMAPDLKSVKDLERPEIIKLFQDPEDPSKGRILTCVPGWECEKINLKQITALGLDKYYNPMSPGSETALWASLKGAYDKGDPWIGKVWSPTWIAGMLDLTILEQTPYSPDGFEKGLTAWPACDLWIVTSNQLAEKAPDLFPFLVRVRQPSDILNEGLAYMRENDAKADEAALWFLKNRQELWTKWVSPAIADKVKAALALQ